MLSDAARDQSSRSPKAPRRLSRPQVRKALRDHCMNFVSSHFEKMLVELDEVLFSQAQDSASNADQTQFFEAMNQFREFRPAIQKDIGVGFKCAFDEYFGVSKSTSKKSAAKNGSVELEELTLVDQAEWEDDLAVSILTSRVESACAQNLWALNQRLAVLCGGRSVEELENPLGPIAMGKALQASIASLDITEKAKSKVYDQFNQSVLGKIDGFLTESNELLARKGILPDLKYSLAQTRSGIANGAAANSASNEQAEHPMRRAEDALPNDGSAEQWQQSMRAEQRLLDAIISWQLQNLAVSSTGVTRAGVPLGALFSTNAEEGEGFTSTDYVQVLNDLQDARKLQLEGGVVAVPSVTEFQQEFVGSLNDYAAEIEEDKKVPAADAGTIDLVGTIFNQILEEESLCAKVKALLSHLHTPFLKIALIDRRFMQEADHPARLLLNELAEAGSFWVSEDEDKFKVYDKIYQVVHRIIDDFDDNIDFIDQLREDFDNFVERVQKRVELAEKRSSQAEEGLDKLEIARKKAKELYHRRARSKNIPLAAQDILEPTWVDFLVFVYLRFGSSSETWKKAVMMMNQSFVRVHAALLTGDDELASSEVEDKLKKDSGASSAQSAIESIDAQLRIDILDLGYAEQDVSNMFALIEKASAVRPEDEWRDKYANRDEVKPKIVKQGIDIGAPEVDESLEADINLEFEVRALEDDLDEQEQVLREKLRSIAYGTWFEWLETDGAVEKKLKLAWYSSMSDNYMFVNQAGVKVLVETLNNLTRNVHRGHIRVININNESFMERMFRRMINNMQSSA